MPSSSKPLLRPMEKIMLGITGFFVVGILIFGFMPPNNIRGLVMMGYVLAFTAFFLKPFGIQDKNRPRREDV